MNALIYALSFILLVGAGTFAMEDIVHMSKLAVDDTPQQRITLSDPDEEKREAKAKTEQNMPDVLDQEDGFVPEKSTPQEPEVPPAQPQTAKRVMPTPSIPALNKAQAVPDDELEKPREVGGGLRSIIFGRSDDEEEDDGYYDEGDGTLFVSGVLQLTNAERYDEGLPSLELNGTLSHMAEVKLADMFAQDYFDHDSPQGVGVSDLADHVGYEYLLVGENLAYGDFRDNKHLVESWMDSPGHRANIMHKKYSEIGIAVGKGEFEGKQTWLAVQEFGLPRDVCPYPSERLKNNIQNLSDTLAGAKTVIDEKRNELASMPPNDSAYLTAIEQFNDLVGGYNAQVERQKSDIAAYNREVEEYNTCIEVNS